MITLESLYGFTGDPEALAAGAAGVDDALDAYLAVVISTLTNAFWGIFNTINAADTWDFGTWGLSTWQ